MSFKCVLRLFNDNSSEYYNKETIIYLTMPVLNIHLAEILFFREAKVNPFGSAKRSKIFFYHFSRSNQYSKISLQLIYSLKIVSNKIKINMLV